MTRDQIIAIMDDFNIGLSNGFGDVKTLIDFNNALRAVVELHYPSGIFCRGCGINEEYNEPAQLLPCPTILAIEKAISG
jgi:hypothetical protein